MTHDEGAAPLVVVMGVAGAGKSAVGERLAARLAVPFVDGDALHPESNVAKMTAGSPLTDEDRWPWLAIVGTTLAEARQSGLVVACSALRVSYRDAIRVHAPSTVFVHLDGSVELLRQRLGARAGHFMPPALLDSQLAVLEPLGQLERGGVVSIAAPLSEVVRATEAVVAGFGPLSADS